jgi:hypothetical protein
VNDKNFRQLSLLNKSVLCGLNYFKDGKEIREQKQVFGVIESVELDGIRIRHPQTGEEFNLPPFFEEFHPAAPGEYRMRSTGEVVVNPDFTAEFSVYPPTKPPQASEPELLNWVQTFGGPHIVLPSLLSNSWEGSNVPANGRIVEANFRYNPTGPATDYDRACDIKNWSGIITVGNGSAIVLGGDLTIAAYYNYDGNHYLLRWLYAPNESSLLTHFHDVREKLSAAESFHFKHPGGLMYLMDSADVAGSFVGEYSTFELPAG